MRNHGTDPASRGRLLDERVRAMRRIWTEELAEFHGEFVDFDPVYAWPKPVQQPHPPIYVGGESERAIARVAEYGQGWLPRSGTKNLAESIGRVRDLAGWRVPVALYAAPADAREIDKFAEAGVDRLLFLLPTRPRDESLRRLDEIAAVTAGHR
jgi:alkanesulfonate monooxygenase SsuD/methylene tetrahydromethanopterin reductase-like flavin-dependent oxidoreductase (luciferase family)